MNNAIQAIDAEYDGFFEVVQRTYYIDLHGIATNKRPQILNTVLSYT